LSYAFSVGLLAWRFARHANLPLSAVLLPSAQLRADLHSMLSRRPAGR